MQFFVNFFSDQPIFNLPLDGDVNYIYFYPSLVDVIASAAAIINFSVAVCGFQVAAVSNNTL